MSSFQQQCHDSNCFDYNVSDSNPFQDQDQDCFGDREQKNDFQPGDQTSCNKNNHKISGDIGQSQSTHLQQQTKGQVVVKMKKIIKIQTASPGESKNLYKCFGRQLKLFIKKLRDKSNILKFKDNEEINKILKIPGDKIGKFELNKILNSPIGNIISKEFFGQCLWKFNIVKKSKISVSDLFRHNIEPYLEVIKKENRNV